MDHVLNLLIAQVTHTLKVHEGFEMKLLNDILRVDQQMAILCPGLPKKTTQDICENGEYPEVNKEKRDRDSFFD